MLPYVITVAIVVVITSFPQKKREGLATISYEPYQNRTVVLFVILLLTLVAGLRYGVGTDYWNYVRWFDKRIDSIWSALWDSIVMFKEPGLPFITAIGSIFSKDYVAMFFCGSLVTVALNIKTIQKYSEDFRFGCLLYILIGSWTGSFNGIRQYLASAIIFYGHRAIFDKNLQKWAVVILLAVLFHKTALIMFPIYFIINRKSKRNSIILLLTMMVIMFFSKDYFFEIMGEIKGSDQTVYEYMNQGVNAFRTLVAFAPVLLISFLPSKTKENAEIWFYSMMLMINAGFMISMSSNTYLARVGVYTEIYATIAFPKIMRRASGRNNFGTILKTIIIILYAIFWSYEIYIRSNDMYYHWIFER